MHHAHLGRPVRHPEGVGGVPSVRPLRRLPPVHRGVRQPHRVLPGDVLPRGGPAAAGEPRFSDHRGGQRTPRPALPRHSAPAALWLGDLPASGPKRNGGSAVHPLGTPARGAVFCGHVTGLHRPRRLPSHGPGHVLPPPPLFHREGERICPDPVPFLLLPGTPAPHLAPAVGSVLPAAGGPDRGRVPRTL